MREVSPWLVCYLDDNQLPGIVKVDCSGQKRKIDVKDPPNQGNAKITIKGFSPSDVKITITIWTPDHLEQWQDIKAKIRTNDAKNTSKTVSAVNIRNPISEEAGVNAIIIENISGIDFDEKKGTGTIVISAKEFAKPVSVPGGNGTGGANAKYQHLVDSYILMANTCASTKTGYPDWSSFCINSGAAEFASKPFPGYMQYMPYSQSGGKVS